MTKNIYDQLENSLKEKGFWTPMDARRNMNVTNIKDVEEAKERGAS